MYAVITYNINDKNNPHAFQFIGRIENDKPIVLSVEEMSLICKSLNMAIMDALKAQLQSKSQKEKR